MDDSHTVGVLASERFHLFNDQGQPRYKSNVTFGCGFDNAGTYLPQSSGIFGFGGGISFAMQLGPFGRRFSHCFIPERISAYRDSHLYLGSSAIVMGESTPLDIVGPHSSETFYYVNLTSIKVGNTLLPIPDGTFARNSSDRSGGVFVDTGTPYSRLQTPAFDLLVKELEEQVPYDRVHDMDGQLCYWGKQSDLELGTTKVPIVTLHFLEMEHEVYPLNLFDPGDNIFCLAVVRSEFGDGIIGSHMMQDVNVMYDLKGKRIYLHNTDCVTVDL